MEIGDTTRIIQLPLTSFVDCESTGALIDFASVSDNRPDFEGLGANGAGFAITFDDVPGFEDQGSEICSQMRIRSWSIRSRRFSRSLILKTLRSTGSPGTLSPTSTGRAR